MTSQILDLLSEILFSPLTDDEGFEKNTFEIEKKQVLTRLESEFEDPFFFAHKELDHLYFEDPSMQLVPEDLITRISEESPNTCLLVFKNAQRR